MYLLHNFSPDVLCINQIWAYFIKMGSNFLENVIKLDCLTPKDLYIKYTLQVELSWVHLFKISERNKGTIRQYQSMQ